MKAAATRALSILALALALAAYTCWLEGQRPARTGEGLAVPALSDGLPLLSLGEARQLWHAPGTVFVDVRSREDYRVGHISGAINLPEEALPAELPRWQERLGQARAIIVYCKSRDCGKSLWAALRLREAGLGQTWIYPGGWNEWYTDGLPVSRDY